MNEAICGFLSQHAWELPAHTHDQGLSTGLPALERLKPLLLPLIDQGDVRQFLIQMEAGPALDAAEAVLALRHLHALTLSCVIPFEEQHMDWPERERNRYFSILERCDHEHMLQRPFSLDCYQQSARYILARCQVLLAVWDGAPSDVGTAVATGRKQGIQVQIISPTQL